MKEDEKFMGKDDNISLFGKIIVGGLLIFGLIIVNFGGNVFYHYFFDNDNVTQITCECDCCECEIK